MANAACLLVLALLLVNPAYAVLSGGVQGVTASDDLTHYGNEYWVFASGDSGFPTPVFVGVYPGTTISARQVNSSYVVVTNSYAKFEMNPLTGSMNLTILEIRNSGFRGVQKGDRFLFTPFSTKPYWYDNAVPFNIGSIKGYNGYEWQGSVSMIRGNNQYAGSGDFEHVWGYGINAALYSPMKEIAYEQWAIIVTNRFSGVIWQYTNKFGQTWQDGGVLFLDDGTYNRLGSTVSGYQYSTSDGTNCQSFAMVIGSSRGQLSLNMSSGTSLLPTASCSREISAFSVSGTIGASTPFAGWAVVEAQRSGSAPPPPPPPPPPSLTGTSISLSISPSSVVAGGKVTASGTLVDSKGQALAGETVIIQTSKDQVNWGTSATLTTRSDGSFSTTGPAPYSFYARAVFNGDSSHSSSTSTVVAVTTH
ncbi:MAG TPA: hypothetical protein VKF15_01805 [Nitrososphaerales archaeon]|nr:hypothetical protein [Nitrososphaerales archaeon]